MKRAALFVCLLAGMALASTKSYHVTLHKSAMIGGTELKAGDYKLELKDQKVVIRHGSETTEANVKVENADRKFDTTTVRYNNDGDGKNKLEEIHLGGTHMKLVLDAQPSSTPATTDSN